MPDACDFVETSAGTIHVILEEGDLCEMLRAHARYFLSWWARAVLLLVSAWIWMASRSTLQTRQGWLCTQDRL
jgi:hypothetical protein